MIVKLTRTALNAVETLGILEVFKDGVRVFDCHTLERPWLDNKPEVSCIPADTYHCAYTNSIHLSKLAGHAVDTYEVQNVPKRAGIRIHSASYYSQLEGCIALGYSLLDINADHELDLLNSRQAIKDFETLMNKEQFDLVIIQ